MSNSLNTSTFHTQAHIYYQYRPGYPAELFKFLSTLTKRRKLVWDCGTGNGQAAIALAEYYQRVVATDISSSQIEHAIAHPNIQYFVFKAEDSSIPVQDADLVTVSNALHWFDLNSFYTNVRSKLAPEGIIAAWAYGDPKISSECDSLLETALYTKIRPYWAPANELVRTGYKDLHFPFQLIETPNFEMKERWNLDRLLNFFSTWSAVSRFKNDRGHDPVSEVREQLLTIWQDPHLEKDIRFSLTLRVGRVT